MLENSLKMKDRIAKILSDEGITGAKFAEEIGVQASSISHILSGRNNPGTDFLIKILERYRGISAEWLLLGKGEMHKQSNHDPKRSISVNSEPDLFNPPSPTSQMLNSNANDKAKETNLVLSVEKIIVFYTNNTFKTYFPE